MIRPPTASRAATATPVSFVVAASPKRASKIRRVTRQRSTDRVMTYTVKELFYTLQGEGRNAGRPAVFCRFAGCNLWSGREQDRATAVCRFCDTAFVGTDGPGGGKFAAPRDLTRAIASNWPASGSGTPFVVCTGGEP